MARRHVSTEEVAQVFRMLSTLLEHGFTLDEALELLRAERFANERLREVLRGLHRRVHSRGLLSNALSEFPDVFGPMCVELVRTQELSNGRLEATLRRAAELAGAAVARSRDHIEDTTSNTIAPSIVVLAALVLGVLAYYAGMSSVEYLPPQGLIERGVVGAALVAAVCGVLAMSLVLVVVRWWCQEPESVDVPEVEIPEEALERFITTSLLERAVAEGFDVHLVRGLRKGWVVRRRSRYGFETLQRLSERSGARVIAHLKAMGQLDPSISALPQEGVVLTIAGGRSFEFALATAPTQRGERLTLTRLGPPVGPLMLEDLGMGAETMEQVRDLIHHARGGVVLVAGPPQSGKTTTLHALMTQLNRRDLNLIAVENRVKRTLSGVSQIEVDPAAGLTQVDAFKAALRHDPDVLAADEIGSGFMSTLLGVGIGNWPLLLGACDGSDVEGVLWGLREYGTREGMWFEVCASLEAVLVQRLVRRLCETCRVPYVPEQDHVERLGLECLEYQGVLYRASGCEACFHRGYQGHIGLFEVVTLEEVQGALLEAWQNDDRALLRSALEHAGVLSLHEQGLRHALNGLTTIEELLRVELKWS